MNSSDATDTETGTSVSSLSSTAVAGLNRRVMDAPTDADRRAPTPRFFSFKWKALLLFGLVPALTTALFTVVSYRDQIARFDAEREAAQAQYQSAFSGLVREGATDLLQLGSLIPSLDGVAEALISGHTAEVRQAFEPHWPLMQLELELELVRLYDVNGRFFGGWSIPGADGVTTMVAEERWVQQVIDSENAVNLLDCVLGCLRYGLVPLLAEGRSVGVAVLATSLADNILAFRDITGADIGVLVPASGIGSADDQRTLPGWNFKWVALTDPTTNRKVLRAVARQFPPPGREHRVV